MRFATFTLGGLPGWGAVIGDAVAVLSDRWPSLKTAIAANALDEAAVAARSATKVALADIDWLPVLPDPGKILCVGLNYEAHRQETGRPVVGHPTIFTRFADSQTGHLTPILMPAVSDKLDYEGELAVVIGRAGCRIPAAQALDHVAGYSCYNDGSVRDWQNHTMQFTPGKNFFRTGAFGPWLVTPDEFGPLGPQRLQTRLNGQRMQDARIDQMIFPVATILEYCSTFTKLSPGDVIVSGTPGGVGQKRNPPIFMQEGDHVEVEIDGIGVLSNSIARAAAWD
jgi:2-keto-4-pentenoate hydratase/2-oxohepta-3-ene-1,7-dioic acid hydratase in catechol pathway